MSKGGKITTSGEKINVIKLDDIKINNEKKLKVLKLIQKEKIIMFCWGQKILFDYLSQK